MSDRKDRRLADDDDGRTIADMSGVDGHGSLLSSMIGLRGDRKRSRSDGDEPGSPAAADHTDNTEITREERRWYIFGALKAALLIFLAFALGLGLIVLLMVLFW